MRRLQECSRISSETGELLMPRKIKASSMKKYGLAEGLQVQRQQF
jgi:hypothetical protein